MSSSAFRKAQKAHRRTYKERGQIESRSKFGFLEKKKDYVKRARNYHSKQDRLKALSEKASFRNPDEFYFGMVNQKTSKGKCKSISIKCIYNMDIYYYYYYLCNQY